MSVRVVQGCRSERQHFDFVVCASDAVAVHEVDDAVDVGSVLTQEHDEAVATHADDESTRNSANKQKQTCVRFK